MIEWRYQIQENVCPAHISNTHQVHLKNDVCKHHVVFQKPQYLPEGKEHAYNKLILILIVSLIQCINSYSIGYSIPGVMYHERHIDEPKSCPLPVAVVVEQHPDPWTVQI